MPDLRTRWVLWGTPLVVGAGAMLLHAEVRQPGGLMSALALLAGVLIGSFAFVSTMRTQASQRPDSAPRATRALDETATHLLVAVLAAVVTAAVIGALTSLGDGCITGPAAGLVLALATFVLGLLLLIVPRLYMAYNDFHRVDADLSGYAHGARRATED